mgnify:CR=1 FL=1|tara:strand:+ start:355 stop:513 length:159 start_codon:yes stop_codon:yes gene_type:complete
MNYQWKHPNYYRDIKKENKNFLDKLQKEKKQKLLLKKNKKYDIGEKNEKIQD